MTNKQNKAPVNKWMIVRTVVLVVALINQTLVLSGFSALPFDDAQVESAVTVTLTVGASLLAWWKDNDVTHQARKRTQYNKDRGLK